VIIAARNAEASIDAAVASALAEPEVTEVIVVDDASADGTAQAARAAARGDVRLKVLSETVNAGPGAARNRAIRESAAPFIAILDADDRFAPGRFARLFASPGWDMAADNIAFVREGEAPALEGGTARSETLSLSGFVRGNLSRKGVERGELGFLKPVLARDFLDRHGLAYDPALRLGEDYDLYVRCLIAGARFALLHEVGYVATVRETSLSARHRTEDLAALLEAAERHFWATRGAQERAAIRAHRAQIRRRYLLRAFLDRKAQGGMAAALRFALLPPSRLGPVAAGILRDKLAGLRPAARPAVGRTLIPLAGSAPR
jgi:succinoglycan biosynthesis protein ExoU